MVACGVSPTELARIQADTAAVACDTPCSIQRKAITSDNMGQDTVVYNTISNTMCGKSQPTGTQLQNYDYLIGSLATWQVKLPVGTDVDEQDHILVGSDTLEVQIELSPQSYQALIVVLATEIR